MKVYAVVGQPNDLSAPVDSVWTTRQAAEDRATQLSGFSIVAFELDKTGETIN